MTTPTGPLIPGDVNYSDGLFGGDMIVKGDVFLGSSVTSQVTIAGDLEVTGAIDGSLALSTNYILVGDALSAATGVAMSGDATIVDGGALTIENDAITTVKILDDAVTTAKILDDAVTTAKILDANVTSAKILDDAVTTAKILDANVTAVKLADTAVTAASYTSADITVDAQGRITAAASGGGGTLVLTDSQIFVGDGANEAQDVAMSGDITISNTGVTAIIPSVALTTPDIGASTGTSLTATGTVEGLSVTDGTASMTSGTITGVTAVGGTFAGTVLVVDGTATVNNTNITASSCVLFSRLTISGIPGGFLRVGTIIAGSSVTIIASTAVGGVALGTDDGTLSYAIIN
jgi:hypothetical protein